MRYYLKKVWCNDHDFQRSLIADLGDEILSDIIDVVPSGQRINVTKLAYNNLLPILEVYEPKTRYQYIGVVIHNVAERGSAIIRKHLRQGLMMA